MTPTHTMPDVGAMNMQREQISLIMEQAQVFASAWSLVGGPFDYGNALETAEQEKANLQAMLAASPAAPTAQAAVPQDERGAFSVPVELGGVAEVLAEGDGFWRECSGCYETCDGHPVGHYPYSAVLRCNLGGGCSECGGIGAVWDDTDYEAMAEAMERQEYAEELERDEARAASTSANVAAAAPAQPGEAILPVWFDAFLKNVCEIPDRNSPEDQPEAIVATPEELKSCALNAIEQFDAAPQAARAVQSGNAVAWERLAAAWLRGRAAAQAQNNERWPEHAKAYDRWRYYVAIAQALADELEGKALRPRDTLDPQPARTAVVLDDGRAAFEAACNRLAALPESEHEKLYDNDDLNTWWALWKEARAARPQPVAQTERALTADMSPIVDAWIRSRGTSMDGNSYAAAVQLATYVSEQIGGALLTAAHSASGGES